MLNFVFSMTNQNIQKANALLLITDHLNHNIEKLNMFNLSFDLKNIESPLTVKKHLITDTDKEAKKADKEVLNAREVRTADKLGEKLGDAVSTISTILKAFNHAEQQKLIKTNLHLENIKLIKSDRERIVALRAYIIPKKQLFQIARTILLEKKAITMIELDLEVQKVYVTNSRSITPYAKYLKAMFTNELFANSEVFEYHNRKKILGKEHRNVITLKGVNTKGAYARAYEGLFSS